MSEYIQYVVLKVFDVDEKATDGGSFCGFSAFAITPTGTLERVGYNCSCEEEAHALVRNGEG